jgi:hypothetical protein
MSVQRFLGRFLVLLGRLRLRCLLLLLALRARLPSRAAFSRRAFAISSAAARDLLLLDLLLQVGEVREQVDAAALRLAPSAL